MLWHYLCSTSFWYECIASQWDMVLFPSWPRQDCRRMQRCQGSFSFRSCHWLF
jgi:hypothetical protein